VERLWVRTAFRESLNDNKFFLIKSITASSAKSVWSKSVELTLRILKKFIIYKFIK
jgi:hypothetical protein